MDIGIYIYIYFFLEAQMVTLQFMKRYPIGNVSQTETLLTGFDK